MERRNKLALILISIIFFVALSLRVYGFFFPPTGYVFINGQFYEVLVADTYKRQIEGLGNKEKLGKYLGMYFVFGDLGNYTFVMRDMMFPLDIIWLNGDTVVYIKENAAVERNVNSANLSRYTSNSKSNSVLEVEAGKVRSLNIKIGDKIRFCRDMEGCGR